MMESAEIALVKEEYNGIVISFGNSNNQFLIETDEYVPHQIEIFEMVKDLEDLKEFRYTSKFETELYYDSLVVNKNLRTLHITDMDTIDNAKQLGNIENLRLDTFYSIRSLKLLPESLKNIKIYNLNVGNEEEYNTIVGYFDDHNIKYSFENYYCWSPDN